MLEQVTCTFDFPAFGNQVRFMIQQADSNPSFFLSVSFWRKEKAIRQVHSDCSLIYLSPFSSTTPSFTWLCGQVHRNFLSKYTGQVVELFDEEFRHLYALSKPVAGLRPPLHTSFLLLNKSTAATQGSLTNSSNQGSIHTSDPFSCLSNDSISPKPTRTPVYSRQPTSPLPLNRVHSFHGYTTGMMTQPPNGIQVNYYQRQYIMDSPAVLYNNVHIYRPVRMKQEDVNRARMNPVWRCLHRAKLT